MFFVLIIMSNHETTLWTIFSVYFSVLIVPPRNINITNDADADNIILLNTASSIWC